MKITFETPKKIIVVKEIKQTIEELTVEEIIDNPEKKFAKAYTNELGIILLWEGEDYTKAGQWTDTDVVNRIKELYK